MSRRCSVFVVDDDAAILEYYRKLFQAEDGEFDILGSSPRKTEDPVDLRLFGLPSELLAAFAAEQGAGRPVPLCILDMRMPEQSGLDAALALRSIDPEVTIVICTAYSDEMATDLKRRLRSGVFLVQKPFAVDEFRLLVHSLLREWEGRETLRGNEERLRRIIEATHVGTWEWKIPTGETVFNERWAEIVGYTLAELEPVSIATWEALAHPEDGARTREMRKLHFAGELPYYDIECRMRHRDGHWVWVQDRGQVVERDRSGAPLHMSGTLTDISDRKAAEAEIQAMNAALKKSNEKTQVLAAAAMQATIAKSDFLANMSHEIRTPLNAIIGFSELVRKSQLDQKQRQFIDTVLASGQLLLSIIEDILDYSKIGSGSIELESLDVDPRRMTTEMLRMFELRVDASLVRLSAEVAPDVPATLRGDPTRLRQVLLNLLSNAVKFTERGEIVLGVARGADKGGDPVLRFSVRDSGIGIPRDRQEAIFSAFEQVDMSTTRKHGGTGLGLAISMSLARLMGGDLGVESEPGRGSTFTFTVPESRRPGEVAKARGEPAGAVPADPIKGLRVLVAEDVETNRMLLSFMLADLGCSVEFAHDGLQAIEALRRGGFDLCLMDIQMPVMGGIEASKLARAEGLGVPIIAVTAAASLMDEEACREAGMEGFVTKPLDKRRIAAAILAAFDHGSR